MASLEREVSETFKRHYLETGDRTEAWNATLLELAPDARSSERRAVADILREEADDLVGKLRGKVKRKVKAHTYTVHGLDVWGNESDGFEVNDVYPSSGKVEFPADATHDEMVRALKDEGFIDRNIRMKSVEIEGDDQGYDVSEAQNGKPVYQLRLVD